MCLVIKSKAIPTGMLPLRCRRLSLWSPWVRPRPHHKLAVLMTLSAPTHAQCKFIMLDTGPGIWHLTFGGWGVYFLHPESFYFRVNYYFQWTREHSILRAGIIFMEFNWNSQCISIFLTTVPWQSVWSTCTYNSSWECEYSLTLFRPPDILGFKLKYCKLKRKQSFKNPRSTCT